MNVKYTFLLFLVVFVTASLQAQTTITNATFPVAGDSLRVATDIAPAGIVMTPAGGPQVWDFSGLHINTRSVTPFYAASTGSSYASFPGAELVSISDQGVETYFDVNASAFSTLGIGAGGLSLPLPFPVDLKYSPALPERRAPLMFFDIHQSTSNAVVAVSVSEIPGDILDSLGIPTDLFDSIRLRITVNRLEVVDAYGVLSIPGGTYNVLREKRTDINGTGVDVHTFLGWVDISTILGGTLPGFGPDTVITYQFLSNDAKEPIALVTTDSTGNVAQEVEFKDNGLPSAVEHVIRDKTEATVSPNPASDLATFDFKNLLPGDYSLHVFDMHGQTVLTQRIANSKEDISLHALSEGQYFFQLTNAGNKIVSAGKFLKVKG